MNEKIPEHAIKEIEEERARQRVDEAEKFVHRIEQYFRNFSC